MPVTVNHVLTATTPDNTSYEIRPSHWNSAHSVSLAISGTDIIGAFSNQGNVSFGTNGGGYVTASANVTAAPSPLAVTAGTASGLLQTLQFANGSGVSFGLNGSTLTASVNSNAGGAAISAGTVSQNSGTVVFSNSNNVTFGMNGSTVTAVAPLIVGAGTGTYPPSSLTSLAFANNDMIQWGITSGAGSSGFIQPTITAVAAAMGGTNTLGAVSTLTTGTLVLAGGSNITLSQSRGSITIIGPNPGAANLAISALGTSQNSGTVSFANANGVSFNMTGSTISGSIQPGIVISAGTHTNLAYATDLSIQDGGGVSWSLQGGSNPNTLFVRSAAFAGTAFTGTNITGTFATGYVSLSVANPASAGNAVVYGGSNTTGTANSTYPLTSIPIAGAGIVSVGNSAGSLVISGPAPATLSQMSMGISGGNTSGNTGTVAQGQVVFAGGANVTLSGSTAGSNMTITVSAGSAAAAPVNFSAGTTSNNLGSVVFSNSNGVSFGLSGSTITASAAGGGTGGVAIAASNTTFTSGTVAFNGSGALTVNSGAQAVNLSVPAQSFLSGGANITVSTTNNATITIIGASVAGQPVNFSAGTTSNNLGSVVFSNSNGVSFGLSGSTITASAAGGGTGGLAISALGSSQNSGTVSFANNNGVSFNMTGSTISASIQPGIVISAGTHTNLAYATDLSIQDAGGISWSLQGGSNPNTLFVRSAAFAGTAFTGTNITGTFATGYVSLSVANPGSAPVNFSAGTTSNNLGSVVFSNSNGVSFGLSGSTITASAAAGGGAALSAAGGSQNTGTVSFANSNGVSFGYNAGTITASAAGGGGTSIAGIANSQTTYSSGTVALSEGGGAITIASGTGQKYLFSVPQTSSLVAGANITVSTAGSTISIIGAAGGSGGTAASVYAVSQSTNASSMSVPLSSLQFAGYGIISVGASNGTIQISGPQPVALSGSNSSATFGTLTFGNLNGLSHYFSNGSMVGSYTVPSQTVQTQNLIAASLSGNTAGALALVSSGTLVLAGGNNITLSQNGQSVTISGPNVGGAQTGISSIVASNGTFTSGQVSFSNANNVTFGTSGTGTQQAITASYSQTNQTVASGGIAGSGFTTTSTAGVAVVGTHDSAGLKLGVPPFITTYVAQTVQPVAVSNSAGSFLFSTLNFSNANNVTWGTSAGSIITASVAAAAGITALNVSANGGGTSNNVTQLNFNNGNGVTFGMSTAASIGTVTASVAAQTNQTMNWYVTANSTGGASSTNLDARTISMVGYGGVSAGFSNGSVQISAPATSSLVGASNISVSSNGSTISVIGQGAGTGYTSASATNGFVTGTLSTNGLSLQVPYITRYMWPWQPAQNTLSAFGNGTASFQYISPDLPVTATRLDALAYWSAGSSAASNTMGIAMSVYGAIYTVNGSSLSSLSSGSTQATYTYASNSAGQTQLQAAAIRPISVPINVNMAPGQYIVGFNMVTAATSIGANTTNIAQTVSMVGGTNLLTATNFAEFTVATATSSNPYRGMGLYSAATTGLSGAYSISGINATGANLAAANIGLIFRNA